MNGSGTDKPGVFFLDECPARSNYEIALNAAIQGLAGLDPAAQARRGGAPVVGTEGEQTLVEVDFCGKPVRVAFPSGKTIDPATGKDWPLWERIVILHYLGGTDPVPHGSDWIGYRQVPAGTFYFDAFRRRAHVPLAKAFGDDPARLLRAGEALGAEPKQFGDASVVVKAFPRVPVAAVVYGGDEEFPADAKVLFDSSVGAYLNTEDIAVLGGLVVGRLIQAAKATTE